MNALLHVEKEKGVEVLFSPSLQDAFCIVGPITVDSRLTSITVSGYSKDENILNGSISKSKLEISCVPKAFCQYLFDRKKAGVMKFGDIVLYVLPPKNRTDLILSCISPTPSSKLSKASQGVASSSSSSSGVSSDQNGKSSSTTNSKNIPSAPAPVPTAVKGDDFLSSLLNKMQSTSKLRSTGGVTAPTSILARVEVVDRYDALASRIRGQLESFKDPEYMELRLEPMDKDGMYVVHDVVDDYPDLASFAVGDLEERHVVVYRRGFQPEGVDLHQQGAALKSFSRKKKDINYGKAVSTNSLQAESISVAKVNPEGLVRDRRTIEEIQQEMKKRKLGL